MRDLNREASYPLAVRDAIATWVRSKTLRPRRWGVRTNWDVVYRTIEEDLASGREAAIVAEFLALAAEAEKEARRRREQRRLDAATRIWERQAVEIDLDAPHRRWPRLYGGKDVWLWHGTSSALLPEIRERGLLAEPPKVTHKSSTPGYVYLTTITGGWSSTGGDAIFYARSAAGKHGGDPVILRAIVPWDELEPDMDDEDIASGRWQFRTPHDIPPEMIREIGEERVGWPEKWPKYRNPSGDTPHGVVLARTHDGLGVLLIDPSMLRRIASDGTIYEKTCPAGLGFAVVDGRQVRRHVARQGWFPRLSDVVKALVGGGTFAIKEELKAGIDAVESVAADLGVGADEVVGVLLDDAEAWAEWSLAGAL